MTVSCQKCVLDTNDYPDLIIDENGICSICHTYDKLAKKTLYTPEEAKKQLSIIVNKIKESGKNKEYNCILGLSGGVDSSYMAYLAKQWNLNPLVVHVDNGWNTELAVHNIKHLVNKLNFDLYSHVINWEEVKDIQRAFIKSSVLDIELPFDNAFFASLFMIAKKYKLKHILFGYNTKTEGWLPPNFTHNKFDKINIKSIHKLYGEKSIKNYPMIGLSQYFRYTHIDKIQIFSPLNYIHFNKKEAIQILTDEIGWREYKYKHYENIFTRFYQGYILPEKFNIDKRKAHLSTLICSNQITKEEALEELKNHPYGNIDLLHQDKEFVLKKLGFSESEFNDIMKSPPRKHTDFPSLVNYLSFLNKLKTIIK